MTQQMIHKEFLEKCSPLITRDQDAYFINRRRIQVEDVDESVRRLIALANSYLLII